MNNFASIFEELSKLYEEDAQKATQIEEDEENIEESALGTALAVGAGSLVGSAIGNALSEDADEDDAVVDEIPAEEIPAEESVEDEEPRRVICECDKCGALVIKDEADVVVDEKTDLANVEDECQFCEEANGYKIIGVVAPYEPAVQEEEAAVEDEPAEEEEFIEESAELDEGVEHWYHKKFDKPYSINAQQQLEAELNGECGEISDERRKEIEDIFAWQRDWEARHSEELEESDELEELFDVNVPVDVTANGNDVAVGGVA